MIKNYRNNNRRRTFRSNDRNFRQNGSNGFNGNADNNSNGRFFRNGPNRGSSMDTSKQVQEKETDSYNCLQPFQK